MVMDGHRIIEVNGVGLCVDTAGDAADPAILLIGGMGASMDWWEEEFCQRLAAEGTRVEPEGINGWSAGTGMCHSRVAWRQTTPPCARTTSGAWSGSG